MSHPHPELSPPDELAPGALRVIPLGGLGEVGRNMTVFEYDGRLPNSVISSTSTSALPSWT